MNTGQILCILGESGCGKTSLLKAIRGFMDRDAGEIYFQDERVYNKSEKLVPGTKGIAIVHQDFQLEPGFTVYDNIKHHLIQYKLEYQHAKTEEIIELCNLTQLRDKTSKQLSGGQKQKVALAKALIGEPPLLLLDEPFSNLDNISKTEFKKILKNIVNKLNVAMLFVTHDSKDALTFSDEIMVIQNGTVIQKGTPSELVQNPPSLYAAQLLGLTNFAKGCELQPFTNNTLVPNADYWIPQFEISISDGDEFNLHAIDYLGDETILHLKSNNINLQKKVQKYTQQQTYNITIKNPVKLG